VKTSTSPTGFSQGDNKYTEINNALYKTGIEVQLFGKLYSIDVCTQQEHSK
jgi:hypothetical protein